MLSQDRGLPLRKLESYTGWLTSSVCRCQSL